VVLSEELCILSSCFLSPVSKVSNQTTLYYVTSNNLCFCTTWQNRETQKLYFHPNAVLVHCQKSTNRCCFNLVDSRLILALLYDFLNIVINVFSSGLSGEWFRRKEVESATAVGLLDYVARTMHVHQCVVFMKEKKLSCV